MNAQLKCKFIKTLNFAIILIILAKMFTFQTLSNFIVGLTGLIHTKPM